MARNILAQLVIALRDNLSPGAKTAAESLNKIKKAADDLNKTGSKGGLNGLSAGLDKAAKSAKDLADAGMRLRDWGGNFDRRLQRLKITGSELDELRRKFTEFNRTLGTVGNRRAQGAALSNWKNEALASLLRVRAEAQNVDRAVNRIGSRAGSGLRNLRRDMSMLAQTFGFGTGAYAGQRAIRAATEGGAERIRGDIRGVNLGLNPMQQASLSAQAFALSHRYPSLSMEQIRTTGRQLVPNVGTFDKAQELLPEFIRARVALKTIDNTGADEGELETFSRAIDVLGRSMSVQDTRGLLDAYIKSRQMDPAAIKAADWLSFAQTAGGAAKGLGVDFLSTVLPAIMSQKKGYRTGTDFASAWQNFVIGRGTLQSLNAQKDFVSATAKAGLREGNIKTKGGRVIDPGKLVDASMFIENPFEWAKKHLIPRLVDQGILPEGWRKGDYSTDMNPEQRARLQPELSKMLSNRRGFEFFSTMIGDIDQIQKYLDNLKLAKGMASVDADQAKDPFVAFQSVLTQLKEVGASMTAPALEGIAPMLNGIAQALQTMAQALAGNEIAANLTLVGTGLLTLAAALKTASGMMAFMGIGGGAAAGGAGVGTAAATGAGVGAAASRLPLFLRGAGLGSRFIPGIGLVSSAAFIAAGVAAGENDVAPGDQADREAAQRASIRRRYRGAFTGPRAPAVGQPLSGSFGIGGPVGSAPGTVSPGLSSFGLNGPVAPQVDESGLIRMQETVRQTKASLEEINGVSVRPNVDTASLDAANEKAKTLLGTLQQIPAAAAGAANAATQAANKAAQSVRTAVRAAYSDYGTGEVSG